MFKNRTREELSINFDLSSYDKSVYNTLEEGKTKSKANFPKVHRLIISMYETNEFSSQCIAS